MEGLARDPFHEFRVQSARAVETDAAAIKKEMAEPPSEHQAGRIEVGCFAAEAQGIAKILCVHAPPIHPAAEDPDDHFSASSSAM